MRSWVFYTECACQNSRGDTASYLKCTFDPISYICCYKSGGGWSGKCSETGEVTIALCGMKNSNHRHLLITSDDKQSF